MLQIATSKKGRGGRRKLPFVFTEHGALIAASVLNSKRAVQMSVFVVRAFVKLRQTAPPSVPDPLQLSLLSSFETFIYHAPLRLEEIE